jgi:hypothetical protein
MKSVLIQNSKGDVYEDVWKNAVKVVNSDQQALHEVCYGRAASFVTSEMNSVNNYCKMISISHLYFSSWSSSGLVKDFPCKHLIDITYVLLNFYQAYLDRKELLLAFKHRPSMILCLNFILYKYSKTTSANRPVNSARHIPLLPMT